MIKQSNESAGEIDPKGKATAKQEHSLHESIYIELFDVVRQSLGKEIEKDKILDIITRIIDLFVEDPYNKLLLYFYSTSQDNYLISHITNNIVLSIGFGVSLGLPKEDQIDIGLTSFCHDFGMADYTHIFQKRQLLGEDEDQLIRKHPIKSAEVFKNLFSEKIIKGILNMHEQMDGEGYPKGKKGSDISYLSKIVSICDVFEAMTHPRNFRTEFTPYETIKVIIKKKNVVFDGRIVNKFVEYLSIYPIGSLVYLNTGETAILVRSNKGYPTRSIVKVLLTQSKEIETSGKIINLLEDKMLYISGPVHSKESKDILQFLKPRGDFEF